MSNYRVFVSKCGAKYRIWPNGDVEVLLECEGKSPHVDLTKTSTCPMCKELFDTMNRLGVINQ